MLRERTWVSLQPLRQCDCCLSCCDRSWWQSILSRWWKACSSCFPIAQRRLHTSGRSFSSLPSTSLPQSWETVRLPCLSRPVQPRPSLGQGLLTSWRFCGVLACLLLYCCLRSSSLSINILHCSLFPLFFCSHLWNKLFALLQIRWVCGLVSSNGRTTDSISFTEMTFVVLTPQPGGIHELSVVVPLGPALSAPKYLIQLLAIFPLVSYTLTTLYTLHCAAAKF